MTSRGFVECVCSNVCNMAASCSQKILFPSVPASKIQAYNEYVKPCNIGSMLTEWQAPTSFCYLPSSGHTFFVKLRFSLQEIVTKDEDKKTITCPEQLISVSCICVSAKNTALYRNTEKEAPANQFKDWRLCLQTEHKGRMDSGFLVKIQHDTLCYLSPPQTNSALFFCLLMHLLFPCQACSCNTLTIKTPLKGWEIKRDTIFPSRNTFQKIIRNQQNQ